MSLNGSSIRGALFARIRRRRGSCALSYMRAWLLLRGSLLLQVSVLSQRMPSAVSQPLFRVLW